MASRVKEDEKNERIIRGLLKLPENRRCINCNSLGPQYVCTNFWTFVCTTCSGIHREFTHRVKSVSMAKFTSQEVSALQEGGNQRAKEIYFKEWDTQRNSAPDTSNVERLRDFIKHIYVDRRYTGDRNYDKPPRGKMSEDGYQGGSRSPPYEDRYDRRYGERSPGARSDERNSRYGYDERRSPDQHGDYRRSPARPEIVNDWRREDRFGNGRKFDDHRTSDGDPKLEERSPERPKDPESSSPPVVRPVREILGENVIPLRISEPPKVNVGRTVNGPVQTQRTASSSSLGSTNGNPVEVKLESTGSLIDFDADPELPVAAAAPQTQQTTMTQSFVQPTSSSNDNNWASFDTAPEAKSSQAHSNVNTLDSVLSQLSIPSSVPGNASGAPSTPSAPMAALVADTSVSLFSGDLNVSPTGHTSTSPFSANARAPAPGNSFSAFPSVGAIAVAPGSTPVMPVGSSSFVNVNDAGQQPAMQHQQPSLFSTSVSQSTSQQFMQPVDGASTNQPWNFSLPQKTQGPLSTSGLQAPQAVSGAGQDITFGGASQPAPADTKSSGRKELPADLFAANYSTFPAPVPGWQTVAPRGMGFAMQYNTAVPIPQPMPRFLRTSWSLNPFDLGNETHSVQTQTFPSMATLQGALPSMAPPSGFLRTSNLGTPSPAWMPPQSLPYASAMQPQAPPYASAVPPRAYAGSQLPTSMPPASSQISGIGSDATYGFVNTDQQLTGRLSGPAAPHPFSSVGGNPFG